MSKRFDNRKLLYILGALIVILLLTVVVKIPKRRSTIREKLAEFDTSEVASVSIIPRAATDKPFEFFRDRGGWSIRQGNIVAKPAANAVDNILSEISGIKPRSLVSVDESKWNDYDLTDSLATRIRFINKKGKTLADIMIGRFSYKQAQSPTPYGGNNIEGTSFVRLAGEKKIYSVDGFLALSFSGRFNDWRDKTFLHFKKDDLTKITFTYPADSSFVLEKKGKEWFAGGQPADSTLTADYFSSITFMDGDDIKNDFKPSGPPEYQVSIEGNNLLNVQVKCYREVGKDEFILNSGLNPDVYFISSKTGLSERLFKGRAYFFKAGKKK